MNQTKVKVVVRIRPFVDIESENKPFLEIDDYNNVNI